MKVTPRRRRKCEKHIGTAARAVTIRNVGLVLVAFACFIGMLFGATMPRMVVSVQAADLINKDLRKARTIEDVRDYIESLKTKPKQRSTEELMQGRRRTLWGGSFEKSQPILADFYGGEGAPGGFYHSVASGDPTQDSVMIWTRFTPRAVDDEITLEFRMAAIVNNHNDEDENVSDTYTTDTNTTDFNTTDINTADANTTDMDANTTDTNSTENNTTENPLFDPTMFTDESLLDPARNPDLKRGHVTVTKATDFIAKIDMTGLQSNTHYAYVFLAYDDGDAGETMVISDIGLTRTAPAEDDPVESLTYAQFSCAHFLNGFFHPYDIASTIENLDLAIFVGDYIYEYGTYNDDGNDAIDQREPDLLPKWETIDLQDYRNRYASHNRDEAVRNLRRRVPLMALWDDHELSDNAFGDANNLGFVGNLNHQPICLAAGDWWPKSIKSFLKCDRNEGNLLERYKAAAQAFWEYLPIRHVPGSMGQIKMGKLTKIMDWGNLTTVAGFDTRLSYRNTAHPQQTVLYNPSYIAAALWPNVADYRSPNSLIAWHIQSVARSDMTDREDESYTIVGEPNFNELKAAFEQSKSKGKPWQVFLSPSMMGLTVAPDLSQLYLDGPTEEIAQKIKSLVDGFLPTFGAIVYRLAAVLASQNIPYLVEDFGGFLAERRKLIKMFRNSANNVIVLGGDLHSAFGYVLNDDADGKPVAVNVGATSVSAPNAFVESLREDFEGIIEEIGDDEFFEIVGKWFSRQEDNCKIASLQNGGFTASKFTMESHTAEWFHVSKEDRVTDYASARAANGDNAFAAKSVCSHSATTLADSPGSLNLNEECSTITFVKERPALYEIPVPSFKDESSAIDAFVDCGMLGCTFPKSDFPPTQAPTQNPRPWYLDLFLIGPSIEFFVTNVKFSFFGN